MLGSDWPARKRRRGLGLTDRPNNQSESVCCLLCVLIISDTTTATAAAGAVTDRKFAVKARLYQALGVTLAVVRGYLHSPKVLQSLISVLKLYATDGQSTHIRCSRCFFFLMADSVPLR